jgi:hypothetical protein
VNANAKELWAAVKGKLNKQSRYSHIVIFYLLWTYSINFSASVATDNEYNADAVVNSRNVLHLDEGDLLQSKCFDEMDTELVLRKMKNTAPGLDNISY